MAPRIPRHRGANQKQTAGADTAASSLFSRGWFRLDRHQARPVSGERFACRRIVLQSRAVAWFVTLIY